MEVTPRAKERLIRSAALLFHARSYAAVGVQELCEHADVRRGSFYYYFPSKEALALAALDADWQSLREDVFEPAFAKTMPPLERFQRWIDLVHEWYVKRSAKIDVMGGCPIGNLGQELSTRSPVIRDKVSEIFQAATRYFEEALADALAAGDIYPIDPRRGANRIFAYVQGMLLMAQTVNDPDVIREMGLDAVDHAGGKTVTVDGNALTGRTRDVLPGGDGL